MITKYLKSFILKTASTILFVGSFLCNSVYAQHNIDSLNTTLAKLEYTDKDYLFTLHQVADFHAYRGHEIAREYIASMQSYADKFHSRKAQNYVYADMATLMDRTEKLDSSRFYLDLELNNSGTDSFEIAQVYKNIGVLFLRNKAPDSMAYYLDRSYGILKRNAPDSLREIASCFHNYGILYDMKENQKLSIDFYMKALDLRKQMGDKSNEAIVHCNLAYLYGKIGNKEQALFHDKRMLALAREVNNEDLVSHALHGLGAHYRHKKELQLSEKYLLEALEIRTRTKVLTTKCYTLYVLGSLYRDMEKYAKSIEFYDKAIEACRLVNNEYTLGNVYLNKARTLVKQSYFTQAKSAIDSALIITEKIKIVSSTKHAYQVKADVEEKLGNHETANRYLRSYFKLEDSIQRARLNKDIQDLQLKYESESNRALIDKQELKLVKGSNQRNMLMLGILSFAFFTLSLFWKHQQKQRQQKNEIKNLKQEQKLLAIDSMLEGQQEERKRIAQDLHDGLGGLLTSVRLQVNKVQNELQKLDDVSILDSAEKLINNACDEVRRIAHDMMPDALVNLGFVDAIEDLANVIHQTGKLRVRIHFSDPEMELTDKQSIMMYRIIQEASNNTLKYAEANNFTIEGIKESDQFLFTIKDDGRGMDVANGSNGKGIENIKSRVQYLEGELNIASSEEGLRYEIAIPR